MKVNQRERGTDMPRVFESRDMLRREGSEKLQVEDDQMCIRESQNVQLQQTNQFPTVPSSSVALPQASSLFDVTC